MNAHARVEARLEGGRTRLTVLRSEPPLSLRPSGEEVYLVGSAAGPLGGDRLRLTIDVGDGASLTLRSIAASVALPGDGGELSRLDVHARVGRWATLRYRPEPLIAAAACRHRTTARLELALHASVEWREELVAGRHGEPPGSCWTRLVADIDGRPLLRHELRMGPDAPGWDGPAGLAGAGAVGMVLRTNRLVDARTPLSDAPLDALLRASVFRLDDSHGRRAELLTACAGDVAAVRVALGAAQSGDLAGVHAGR